MPVFSAENNVSLKSRMFYWNNALPIDLWWRREHKIAWSSKEHRAISFLQQMWEWLESESIKVMIEKRRNEFSKTGDEEIDSIGNDKIISMSQKDIDDEFDSLDIEKL